MTARELEKLVGGKIDSKWLFYLHGTKVFFRQGNEWVEAEAVEPADAA